MSIIELLKAKVSDEQQAIWTARRKQWDDGLKAGEAGLPFPEGAEMMAYKSGVARRRSKAGEIIGFVMRACKCNACGAENYEWRMGCRCWPDETWAAVVPGFSMTYGYQCEARSDPAAPESTFMSNERLIELANAGREVIDIMTGEPIPVEPPVSAPHPKEK